MRYEECIGVTQLIIPQDGFDIESNVQPKHYNHLKYYLNLKKPKLSSIT